MAERFERDAARSRSSNLESSVSGGRRFESCNRKRLATPRAIGWFSRRR